VVNSQNGWPVDRTGAGQDRSPIHGAVTVPNGVLKGDVAVVLRWVARQFDETVEPLKAGTCWGWFVKNIEGSASISNHASGTAIDLNADRHPMGVAASKTFTAKQVAACRAIETAAGGVVRWGGSYSGRPDSMHWEINAPAAKVKAFADKIRSEEDDMGLTADDKKWISAQIATIAEQVWAEKIGNETYPGRTAKRALNDLSTQRDNELDPNLGMRGVPAGTPLDRMVRAADVILSEERGKPAADPK
jgi:hypothetical protein